MIKQVQIEGLSSEELIEAVALRVAAILKGELKGEKTKEAEDEYISRDEVCRLLHFNKTTLHKHTKEGRLTPYTLGNRVLYKRSEVLGALKVKTYTGV